MKKSRLTLILLFCNICLFANDTPFHFFKNSNEVSRFELLIFYRNDCPYCLKLEQEIEKNIDFQDKIKKMYTIKLVDIYSEEGKNLAFLNNVKSVPNIIKNDLVAQTSNSIIGYQSILKLESFLIGNKSFKATTNPLACGNGTIEAGETCDDANTSNSDACLNTCQAATCSDGFVRDGIEQCDDGNSTNGDGCENNCTITGSATCGNGDVESGENCDDGNLTTGDGCNAVCNVELGFSCAGNPSVCAQSAICGNGTIEAGETCDDANTSNSDACLNTCQAATCSDGFVRDGIEQCDDGNSTNGDGCENNCTITGSATCGNGDVESGENCDDGNLTTGDGCNAVCNVELGFSCVGNPSICTLSTGTNVIVKNSDLVIDNNSKGLILKSPNGNCWKLTVNNSGGISTAQVSCPL